MTTKEHSHAQVIPLPVEFKTSLSKSELPTPEWLRSFPGCEHYTDEEATEIIHSLDTYVNIVIRAVMKNGTALDNQKSTTKTIDLTNPIKRAA
jgi:dihydropteroate synthase